MDDLAASGPLRYCLSRARVQGKLRERKRRQEPTPPIFGLTAREVCARRSKKTEWISLNRRTRFQIEAVPRDPVVNRLRGTETSFGNPAY